MDDTDNQRLREWMKELSQIWDLPTTDRPSSRDRADPPEPYCAWYCPISFYGTLWGIYIRESCILRYALEITRFVDWPNVWQSVPQLHLSDIRQQLLRSAFYALYLHEQFHHKVESLGFRLLVATGSDRYRPYKLMVYQSTFGTADCVEESLANAESYRRLNEERYVQKLIVPIRYGLRRFLKSTFRPRFYWPE